MPTDQLAHLEDAIAANWQALVCGADPSWLDGALQNELELSEVIYLAFVEVIDALPAATLASLARPSVGRDFDDPYKQGLFNALSPRLAGRLRREIAAATKVSV
jgi:hypothetical protein